MKRTRAWTMAALALGALSLSSTASADVRLEGAWPSEAPKVSLEARQITRGEALKRLAEQASWSLVLKGTSDDLVDVHIKDQPADKVLGVLLSDGDWVAKRDGGIVSIFASKAAPPVDAPAAPPPASATSSDAAAPPPAPSPPDPPRALGKKRNVKVFGETVHIGPDEVVHDVTVMGGTVEIEGRVTGKLAVFGGRAHLFSTAHIDGDAAVTGGEIKFDPGAEVGGDLVVVGGDVEGADGVKVAGSTELDPSDGEGQASLVVRAGHAVSAGLRTAAFLFILGALFMALGGARAETVRTAIAASPMRSIALGLVGILGTLASLLIVALTIVGIPFAFVGAVAAVVLAFAGTTSAAIVLGAMLFGHKSSNVYLHLAIGCGLFMVMGFLPWIGGLLQTAMVLAGVGGMVSTRVMGFLVKKPKEPQSPFAYR